MLAEKYTDVRDTAETLYELNAEENIRLQCQTRDDYYAFQHMSEVKIKQTEAQLADQQKANADLQNTISDLRNTISDLQNSIAEQAAKIEQLSADLAKFKNN